MTTHKYASLAIRLRLIRQSLRMGKSSRRWQTAMFFEHSLALWEALASSALGVAGPHAACEQGGGRGAEAGRRVVGGGYDRRAGEPGGACSTSLPQLYIAGPANRPASKAALESSSGRAPRLGAPAS